MNIPYVDIGGQYVENQEEILSKLDELLSSGQYIGGEIVEEFENNINKYVGTSSAVALNSGTDALLFALKILGIGKGDEVITQPNSFIASASVIAHSGAKIVFADVLNDQQIDPEKVEVAITKKTKAIIPVYLTGRIGNMDVIMDIAKRHNLYVIEDAAQSIGSTYNGKKSGQFGDFGAFSAHPLKNLNACGDAGYLVGKNTEAIEKIKLISNHGLYDRNDCISWGLVSRLDAIQACILNIRLKYIEAIIEKRRINADIYKKILNKEKVYFPEDRENCRDTYHTFVIQVDKRDELKRKLQDQGIHTAIHYPIPIHLQTVCNGLGYKLGDYPKAEHQANRILSLPIHQNLKSDDIEYIAEKINEFY